MKYFQQRRKRKLYRQWVERSGLPPEAVPKAGEFEEPPLGAHRAEGTSPETPRPQRDYIEPDSSVATHPEVTGDMLAEINKRQLRLPLLYMLMAAFMVMLFIGLVLLIVYAC